MKNRMIRCLIALTLGIVLQAAINMTVVIGVAPTKGMPAPFISYGGSSLLMLFISMGLVSGVQGRSKPDWLR